MKAIYIVVLYVALIAMSKPVSAQKLKALKGGTGLINSTTSSPKHCLLKKTKKASKVTVKKSNVYQNSNIIITWPYSFKEKISQDIYTSFDDDTVVSINILLYQLRTDDSILCYKSILTDVKIKSGLRSTKLPIYKFIEYKHSSASFIEAIQVYNAIPPGEYALKLQLEGDSTNSTFNKWYYKSYDSTLELGSDIRNKLNSLFKNNKLQNKISKLPRKQKPLNKQQLKILNNKVATQNKDMDFVPYMVNGRSYSKVFFRGWFMGNYELRRQVDMNAIVKNEQQQLQGSTSSFASKNPYSFTTTSESLKKAIKRKEDKETNTGYIGVFSNFANNQEDGSQQENNYQEFSAQYNTRVLNIPITIDGYYTTQDKNRIAKASYIRIHYNADEIKKQMVESASSFKSTYRESKARLGDLDYTSKVYISKLKNAQNSIYNELKQSYSIKPEMLEQNGGNIDALLSDTSLHVDKSKIRADKKKIEEQYRRIQDAEKNINKYTTLLNQYKDGLLLDSLLVYKNLDGVNDFENMSTKELAKKVEHVLPAGKQKKLLAGLSNLDIGILNDYESNYTLAGQTLKGLKVGYDFSYVKATVAVGKTEYISRDGYLDRYNTSMARFDFKQIGGQKIGLIYYINSPTKKMFESDNFKTDLDVPTLVRPTHIVSLNYEGKILKDIEVGAEVATSYKRTEQQVKYSLDNTAILTTLGYNYSKIATKISGEWEHIGKDFENNTLPYLRLSTDRYTLATKSTFFKSLIEVGVQYNLLKQSTFSSTATNTKWGFDLRTKSRRYPNIYFSYKPFSTFRSYNDTLAIQQRPLFGEVWVARGMYRYRTAGMSHNIAAVYNKNNSNIDTTTYVSNTAQLIYVLSTIKNVITTNFGWSEVPIDTKESMENYFMSLGYNRSIGKQLQLSTGIDIAFAHFGTQRLVVQLGGNYMLEKWPLAFTIQSRIGKYRVTEISNSKEIWSIGIGINYKLKNDKI